MVLRHVDLEGFLLVAGGGGGFGFQFGQAFLSGLDPPAFQVGQVVTAGQGDGLRIHPVEVVRPAVVQVGDHFRHL